MKTVLTIVLATILFANTALASTAGDVFDKVSKSTVVILTFGHDGELIGQGSGVALSEESIATNCHVIEDARKITVHYQQKEHPAEIQYTDWDRDICAVTVSGLKASSVTIGSSQGLRVGSRIYAIGAPQGLELTISEGIISGLRQVEGGQYIQITAPISPGSSGGGLFDQHGNLLGLVSFYIEGGQNLNFALPVEWISELPERSVDKKIATLPSQDSFQDSFRDWSSKSFFLHLAGDWEEARRHNLKWTEAMPDSAQAWSQLARAYEKLHLYHRAIDAYEEVVRIQPKNAEAWMKLGTVCKNNLLASYSNLHSVEWGYKKCKDAFEKSLSLYDMLNADNMYPDAWCGLGQYSCPSDDKSLDALKKSVKLDPDNACGWSGIGYYFFDFLSEFIEWEEEAEVDHFALDEIVVDLEELGIDFKDIKNKDGNISFGAAKEYILNEAFKYYREAHQIDPQHAESLEGLGRCYLAYSALDDNLRDQYINKAIQKFQYAADAYSKLSLWGSVARIYSEIAEIEPQNLTAWINLGFSYSKIYYYSNQHRIRFRSRLSDYIESSISAFEKALEIDPKNIELWIEIGKLHKHKGDPPAKGIDALQNALRLDPKNSLAWAYLGELYEKDRQWKKAIDSYIQALEYDPDNAIIWYNLGSVYTLREVPQYDKAVQALKESIRLDPGRDRSFSWLGGIYFDTGHFAQSIEAYQKALQIKPRNIFNWSSMGWAYINTGQCNEAIVAFNYALDINPEFMEALHGKGIAYRLVGQPSKSIEILMQAINIDPRNIGVWNSLGRAYKAKDDMAKVMEIYNRLKDMHPETADEYFNEVVLP
jgi:tetratricopeptide (TPR) repeat protein